MRIPTADAVGYYLRPLSGAARLLAGRSAPWRPPETDAAPRGRCRLSPAEEAVGVIHFFGLVQVQAVEPAFLGLRRIHGAAEAGEDRR